MKHRWLRFTILLIVGGCSGDAGSTRNAFLHWDINSSLGLPGGPTPDQVANGKATTWSKEEIKAIEAAEASACNYFRKLHALWVAEARGGEDEPYAEAGYELSLAQARLAWVKGHASATVARMEQAVKFAEFWYDHIEPVYATNGQEHTRHKWTAPVEAKHKSRVALIRVRNALQELGFDLRDVPKQPQIDPEDLHGECTKPLNSRAKRP